MPKAQQDAYVAASDTIDEARWSLSKANEYILRPADMDRGEFSPKLKKEIGPAAQRLLEAHLQNAIDAAQLALAQAREAAEKGGG